MDPLNRQHDASGLARSVRLHWNRNRCPAEFADADLLETYATFAPRVRTNDPDHPYATIRISSRVALTPFRSWTPHLNRLTLNVLAELSTIC